MSEFETMTTKVADGGTGSTQRSNLGAPARPKPCDSDLRLIGSLASFAAAGSGLDPDEVSRLRMLENFDLSDGDRLVVRRLLRPANEAREAADAEAREAAAEARREADAAENKRLRLPPGTTALKRGEYLARVHRLRGSGGYMPGGKAEAQVRKEMFEQGGGEAA